MTNRWNRLFNLLFFFFTHILIQKLRKHICTLYNVHTHLPTLFENRIHTCVFNQDSQSCKSNCLKTVCLCSLNDSFQSIVQSGKYYIKYSRYKCTILIRFILRTRNVIYSHCTYYTYCICIFAELKVSKF